MNDKFAFGKYKGLTVKEVIYKKQDPDYLRWIVNNLKNIDFTKPVRKAGQKLLNQQENFRVRCLTYFGYIPRKSVSTYYRDYE